MAVQGGLWSVRGDFSRETRVTLNVVERSEWDGIGGRVRYWLWPWALWPREKAGVQARGLVGAMLTPELSGEIS